MSLNKLDIDAAGNFLKMAAKEIKNKNYNLVKYKYYKGRKIRAMELLLKIGITNVDDIWNYILNLTKEDCIDVSFDHDPMRDTNTEVYEFKTTINNHLVYIKLTIRNKLVCMSFHDDYYRSLEVD